MATTMVPLKTAKTVNGTSIDPVSKVATHIDIRRIDMHLNSTANIGTASITFVYGTEVNGVFQEIEVTGQERELVVEIGAADFDFMSKQPISHLEARQSPHAIVYQRILGYVKGKLQLI